jgi:hypothetical protein
MHKAGIAQLGERQTEDLKVACSIHAHRTHVFCFIFPLFSNLFFWNLTHLLGFIFLPRVVPPSPSRRRRRFVAPVAARYQDFRFQLKP